MARKPLTAEQKAAMAERLAKAREVKAAKRAEEEAKIKPRTREEEIIWLYQIGNSPQAIARTFRIDVDEVLVLVGEGHISNITFVGDQIDSDEMGREATYNPGTEYKIPYTTN